MTQPAQHLFDLAQEKIPTPLRAAVATAWHSVREQLLHLPRAGAESWVTALPRVFAASEFVSRTCVQHPQVLRELIESRDLARAYAEGELTRRIMRDFADVADEAALKARLRTLRRRELVRIAWRDLSGGADLNEVMATLSELADACLQQALAKLHGWAVAKYGQPRATKDGEPQQLVVLGLGKLGGRELNFSSDVDLIFAYPEEGETQGAHADRNQLSNHEFFVRLGQSLIGTLSETTPDGFVFRVDMRLRPDGASGPLALCFDAMEQYYQTHGRDWERYALIKARVVGGDIGAGAKLLTRLRPFVFRKYLDYGALNAIRDMKVLIEREMTRKGMQEHVKLGPGGIREIEFLAQALQLVRGGREPLLQASALLTVLPRLAAGGYITPQTERELTAAYVFLRNVEHRLQMAADRQTHTLPNDVVEQTRLAFSMGFTDWATFAAALAQQRERVGAHFTRAFGTPRAEAATDMDSALGAVWLGTMDADADARALLHVGFADPAATADVLIGFRNSATCQALSPEGRRRLDRLMPKVIAAAAGVAGDPATTLARLVHLLEAIGRRSNYFVMLAENPNALSQLVQLCAASEWIERWVAQHPIVLDELLDLRSLYEPLTHYALAAELRARMVGLPEEDVELQMEVLREFHHSHLLRVAAADIGPGLPAEQVGVHLARIADVLLEECLTIAWRILTARHGFPRCAGSELTPGIAVIGYGKLGSLELGYASDLDMIFLYEDCEDGATDGARSLANEEFFARLGQRLIHLLTTRTPSGLLYEVDMRLRPSGQSGALVTSTSAFRDYQKTKAWNWEHQALVRARAIAGQPALRDAFAAVRQEILCQRRDPARLKQDVVAMRERMHSGHPPPEAGFDLKHSRGGIVDIEFMVQYWTLGWAQQHPMLTHHTDNISILQALQAEGLLEARRVELLVGAFRRYLSMEQRLKLAQRGSVTDPAALGDLPQQVRHIWDDTFNN